MLFTRLATLTLLGSTMLTGACATIMEKDTQQLSIKTRPESQAECRYGTDAMDSTLTAPGTITVERSRKDIDIRCTDKATGSSGDATIASGIEPWFWGNILIGGLLGVGVDFSTGNAWLYPEETSIPLKDVISETPETIAEEPAAPTVPETIAPAQAEPVAVSPAPSEANAPSPAEHPAHTLQAPAPATAPERGIIAPVPKYKLVPME